MHYYLYVPTSILFLPPEGEGIGEVTASGYSRIFGLFFEGITISSFTGINSIMTRFSHLTPLEDEYAEVHHSFMAEI